MANQITDNRTLVVNADSVTPWDDLSGGAAGTLDTDVKIQGTGSIGLNVSNSAKGLLFDAGSAQDWSNNVFYIWINCGIVGLLDTKANAGFTIRFCGATVTDWFEFEVGGSDSWPTAVEGGWVQFVVDIEATASNTNGTPPATTAIRYVGFKAVTAGTMTKMTDNTWIDEIRRLPDGNPAAIVEGRNGGTTDWTWADIVTQLGSGSGVVKDGPGGSYICNGPIQFGISDTTVHGFTDTNQVILWDDQEFAPTDLYGFSALGAAGGTTRVVAGVKTGTGDAATGAQGWTVAAASTGVRWTMDFDDPDLDQIDLHGCSFIHGGDFQLDDPAVSVISSLYVDCDSATVSNSEQLRCKVINANTADGVAFFTTDDISDVVFCEFEFSDGHAVELTTPRVATQTSKGNLFTGYGAADTNDAALYNNSAGAVTVNITDGGDSPTVRNGTSASTTISVSETVTVTVKDARGVAIQGVRVRVEQDPSGTLISQGETNASGIYTFTYSDALPQDVFVKARLIAYLRPNPLSETIVSGSGLSVAFTLADDPIVNLPA